MSLVTAVLSPVSDVVPLYLKGGITPELDGEIVFQIRNEDELREIVSVALVNVVLVREVVALCLLRDARLQRALHCVASQVVGAVVVPCRQECPGLPDPHAR